MGQSKKGIMKNRYQFLGIVALVVLVFGLISWGILAFDPYYTAFIHLTVAVLLLVFFVLGGGIGSLRTKTAVRVAGFGASVLVYSALALALLAMINYFGRKHEFFRYDSTEQKVYTMAPQTEQILSSLSSPLEIRAFFLGGVIDDLKTKDLVERIAKKSDKISLKVIDPEKNPSIVENFGVTENKTLHFLYKREGGDRESKVSRTINEQEIANAILKLTRGDAKTVYYISGHGEPALDDQQEQGYVFLKDAVAGENLTLKELAIGPNGLIPDDAAAIVLAAPEKDLLPNEMKVIKTYIENGGRALLLHQPKRSGDVAKIASDLGIVVGADLVVDQVVRLFEGPALGIQPMVTAFAPHPITKKGMKEGVIFGMTSSVTKGSAVPAGAKITELALTGQNSWAEKKVDLIFSSDPQAALEADDIKGPVSVVATFQKSIASNENAVEEKKREIRVVVFGDADFINNSSIRQLFNRDFFLNSIEWVIGEDAGVSIRSGSLRASTKGITTQQFFMMLLFGAIILPEFLVIVGLSIWWRRKK